MKHPWHVVHVCRIIALGGLAATTQFCRTQDFQSINATLADNSTVTVSASVSCAQQYQLEWWSIFFELILLVIMLGTCFVNAFDRARFIYLTYLSLVTVLLTQASPSRHAGTSRDPSSMHPCTYLLA